MGFMKRARATACKPYTMVFLKVYVLITLAVTLIMLVFQIHTLDNHVAPLSSPNLFSLPLSPMQAGLSLAEHDDIDDDVDDDLKPILKILRQGGYDVSKNSRQVDRSQLPKWSEILEGYGPPKILGLESCRAFRDQIKPKQRRVAPAGIFNSGTNLLPHLLEDNCDFSALRIPRRAVLWQVPWGKHQLASERTTHKTGMKAPYYETLPIISVRDPYTWMQSMCRQNYGAQYDHDKEKCPNIVPYPSDIESHPRYRKMKYIPIHVKDIASTHRKYESMVHLWNEWYGEYIKFESSDPSGESSAMKPPDFPFLVVRMEDLIFHAETVVPQLCKCMGGTSRGTSIKHFSEIANQNKGIDTSGGVQTGLLRSIIKYGNLTNRRAGYPNFQLEAVKDLLDPRIMKLLGYSYENP